DTRKVLWLFRRSDRLSGIVADQPFSLQIPKEAAERSEFPGYRRTFFLLAIQPIKINTNNFNIHRCRIKGKRSRIFLSCKGLKLSKIRSIVAHCFMRCMTFELEERHKSSNCVIHAVRSSSARCPMRRRLRSLSLVGVARGGKSPKLVFIG